MATVSFTNAGDVSTNIRPSEAQLRWAQFHHKRRAHGVNLSCQRLYQTPQNLQDVPGAYPEDGNSTTSISEAEIRERRPKVSRGRRAYLRVSKRNHIKRIEVIRNHGFRRLQGAETFSDGEEEDDLNDIFMAKRRRPRRRGEEKDERVKRFEAACHAMMMNLAQPEEQFIVIPDKRWTRNADHIAASAALDDEYLDPKWGIRRRILSETQEGTDNQFNLHHPAVMPFDRGASWLVHMPNAIAPSRDNPSTNYYVSDPSRLPHGSVISDGVSEGGQTVSTLAMRAPGQQKFNQLVALAQQRLIERGVDEQKYYQAERRSKDRSAEFNSGSPVGENRNKAQLRFETSPTKPKKSYMPRMRLRDFMPNAEEKEFEGSDDEMNLEELRALNQIPRDKYLEALQREKETGRRLSRTQEMAHSLEAEKERNMVSRTKEIARSYEGSKHPKMRLRDFDELGMEAGAHDLVEEEELHPEELVVMNNIVGMHLRKFDIASFEDRSKSLDKADHIVQKFEADEKENHVSRIRQLFYSMNGDETNSEDPGNKPMQLGDFMAVQQIIRARIEQFEIGGNIEQKRRLTRAREMALAFEANTKTGRETKARQLASSFEKPQTRKMQLKNLDFRQNDQNSSARDDMELQPEELVVMQQGIHSRLEKEFEQKTDAEIQEILSRAKEVAEVFEGGSMEETRTTMREMFDILEGEGQEHDRQDEKLQPEEVIVLQNMIHTCIEEIETDGDVEKCGRLTRAKLIAQVFESTSKEQKNGRIRQMVKSLQRDQASGMRTKKLSSGHGGTVTTAYQNSRRRLSEPPRAFDFQTKRESRHSAPCCARCARPSPLVLSSGANSMQAPARTTPRESDFFERIRQNNATSGNMQGYEQDQSRVIDFDKAQQTGPFKRESGYFKQVRQVNSNPMNSTKPNLDLPSNRGSDVFEKVRQMNSEKANRSVSTEEISIDPNLEPHLCDECQAEEFKEEEVDGEGSSSVSRINRGDEVEVVSTTDFSAPKEDRISDTSYSNDPDSRVRFSSQSNISRDSAINDLWNRGRSSLNTLASTLNQQSSAAPLPTHLKETAVSVSERVNHFFQSSPPESNQQSSVLPPSGNLVGSVSVSERVNSFFQNSTSGSNQQPGESPVPGNLKGAAVDVSERVGSFFQIIRNKDESDDADQQSRNELHEFPPSKSIYRNQDDVGGKDQPTLPFRSREQNEVPDTSVVSTPKRRSNGENDSDVGQPVPPQRSKVEQELYDAMQASTPKRNKEEQYAPDEFDADFLAAYRKKRESITPVADDASSASSFQALPSGFREVVKQYSPSRKSHRPSPARKSQGIESPRKPKSSDLSTENVRNFSERSLPPDNFNQGIIDTDGTTSEASNYGMNPSLLSSLMLSPDLLTKRHQQAVRAIERKQWDDVNYLVNANPWLAEMSELTTKQYLLHKIAFFGAGSTPAPLDLCQQLMAKFPAAVHKFDEDGNVPLHLAAAAGHMKMITMLGDEFESGASIRNEDGMLPLHFTIASYGQLGFATNDKANGDGNKYENAGPLPVIKTVLKFFPQAVAIGDNDGNLPLHIAVECLEGRIALDVIYLLLDEADRQLQDPYGARFYNKLRFEEILSDGMSSVPPTADIETDESMMDPDTHCNMVRNNLGESPLLSAIHARKGWQIIETLVSGPGGRQAALYQGAKQNNALHLLVTEFQDPTAALSVLKNAPETSTMRNSDGMLPIEVACMQLMPEEVILAIALSDLHIDITDKEGTKVRPEFGGSWWFLTCECDDHYVDIVQELVSMCSFQQVRLLCLMEGGSSRNKGTVIFRATPKCREVLTQAIRFMGRFEFIGNTPLYSDPDIGLKAFDALDFGSGNKSNDEGRRVILKCYSMKEAFEKKTANLRSYEFDDEKVEVAFTFSVYEGGVKHHDTPQQFWVSIERPEVTLKDVADSMVKKGGYWNEPELRSKYAAKVCSVLRLIAKSLRHLHSRGVIHGDLNLDSCGKFEHAWKLLGRIDVQAIGQPFDTSRFQQSFPPEALHSADQKSTVFDSDAPPVSFKDSIVANPSIDIWAFGKLAYEAIMGKPLVEFEAKKPSDDVVALLDVMEWNESSMQHIFTELLESGGIAESGADLFTSCLFPRPEDRPASMEAILSHRFWQENHRQRDKSKRSRRRRNTDSISAFTETSKSLFTD